MLRSSLFLVLLAACVGCAETQSQRAFIVRPAAETVPAVALANRSPDHDRNLAESLERSLKDQEDEPWFTSPQGAIAQKQPTSPTLRDASDSRASKTAVPEP
jgi:hypothetical protein